MGKTVRKNDDELDFKKYQKKKKQAKSRLIDRKLKTHKGQRKMTEEGNL